MILLDNFIFSVYDSSKKITCVQYQKYNVKYQSLLFLVVTLYSTLGEDGLIHSINEVEVRYIVTSEEQLPKLKVCYFIFSHFQIIRKFMHSMLNSFFLQKRTLVTLINNYKKINHRDY